MYLKCPKYVPKMSMYEPKKPPFCNQDIKRCPKDGPMMFKEPPNMSPRHLYDVLKMSTRFPPNAAKLSSRSPQDVPRCPKDVQGYPHDIQGICTDFPKIPLKCL